jgi:DNA-binding transcriptional MerR regulator
MSKNLPLSIGNLSTQTGVNVETIRYYEKINLLPEPARTASGYRQYGESHIQRLRFIRRGRELGFPIDTIRTLQTLAENPNASCEEADRMVAEHLEAIDQKITDLMRLRCELEQMQKCCAHLVADCKIIESLAIASVTG